MDDFETSELREFSEKRKFFVDSEDLNKKRRKESISAIESLKCAYEEEVTRAEFAEKAYQELYQKFLQSRYCKEFEEGPLLGFGSYGRVFRSTHRLDQCDYAIKRVRFVGSSEILLPEVHALSKLKHEGVIRYYNSWIEVDLITPDMDVEIISYDGNCKIDEDKDGNGDGDESESESESAESKSAESKSESEDEDEDENKIRYFQIGEIQDPELVYFSLFIQMELCKESLSDALQSETIIDYNEGLEYFRQIVEAVSYMHEQAKIGDVDLHESSPGQQLYSAPERRNKAVKVDAKADIYSLGILLFELISKFSSGTHRAKVLQLLTENRAFPEDIKERDKDFILLLLSEQPKDRPSAKEILEWLKQ